MEECLLIDPADLQVEDQELLNANFDKLTCGPTSDKLNGWQKWTQLGARQTMLLRKPTTPSAHNIVLAPNLGWEQNTRMFWLTGMGIYEVGETAQAVYGK